ncbi:hypothetical protein J6590_006351 [Homalodisca vitripennis]|nr:hypothetical protein J6590_006351 [Homalodisca vitripennis]
MLYFADCDFVSNILINECSPEDRPIPAQLCWRLRDPEQGIVEVTYPLLPASCNFTAYDITLMAHEGIECPAFTDNFKKHTRREVDIRGCSEASCKDKCSQRGTVVFRHVFSGCYQLCLTPRRHYQALQELVSSPLALATNYVKTPISTLQDPLFFLDMTQSSQEMVRVYINYLHSNRISLLRLDLINLTPTDYNGGDVGARVFLNTSNPAVSSAFPPHSFALLHARCFSFVSLI